jgi:cyclic pyranopterin phosphate synthase
MVDITYKQVSLRKAIAEAIVSVSSPNTIKAIVERTVPKGDVFEMAKTAGLFAVKRTADMIPDCHPLPIEFTQVRFDIEDLRVKITMEVHTLYKTGVEVEAMHGVSVVALTMYDMLKPIDKGIEISQIRLVEKKGGKSDYKKDINSTLKASVIVCSDSISAGKKEDRAGRAIMDSLQQHEVGVHDYIVIPDELQTIQEKINAYVAQSVNMIILTGGTGLSARDITPEAVTPLLHRRLPGVEETIRAYGQQRTAYSMLSRSVAGMIGNTLVLALPGSTNGAKESMQAIMPSILHVFKVAKGMQHE